MKGDGHNDFLLSDLRPGRTSGFHFPRKTWKNSSSERWTTVIKPSETPQLGFPS